MDALVDRAVTDVEIETVFFGEVVVRAGPAVFALYDAGEIQRLFVLMAVHTIAVQHRLDQADVVKGIRAVNIAPEFRGCALHR